MTGAGSESFTVSFQGERGAYSDLAASELCPGGERVACRTFEDALSKLASNPSARAVIPVRNSIAGPVTTAVALLKDSRFAVLAEHWMPIHHCLLVLPQATAEGLKSIHSHWQALKQCARTTAAMGLLSVEEYDTAGAARMVAEEGNPAKAAIASALAAKEYGLKILKENIADEEENRTLFLIITANEDEAAVPVSEALSRLELI